MDVIFNQTQEVVTLPEEVTELAAQFASPMMDAAELTYLAAALAMVPALPEAIVVEIGTYVGQTAVYMAHVLRRLSRSLPILSIDPFERVQPDPLNPQGRYADYLANVLHHGVADVCLPLVAFSAQAAPVVPACIGLLIVDGSHHYPDVRQDLHLYGPKVLPGGLMFIDDYVEAYPGVCQALDEFFTPSAPWTVLHRSWFVIARRTPASSHRGDPHGHRPTTGT